MLFEAAEGAAGLESALKSLIEQACEAIKQGSNLIILSDRGTSAEMAPIPSLLACSGLHHEMVRRGLRSRAGLVIECGDAREVHHFALLLGYGAGTINPYVAFETLDDLIRQGWITGIDHDEAVYRYRKAIKKGRRQGDVQDGHQRHPELSRCSDLRGDRAQRGISSRPISTRPRRGSAAWAWPRSPRRRSTITTAPLPAETASRHGSWRVASTSGGGMASSTCSTPRPSSGSSTRPRPAGTISSRNIRGMVDEQTERLCTLRGLFEFQFDKCQPVPIEEVEPAESIVKRFATGAMSYGSISAEAHETLAIAMNRMGAKSNTGEGGEDPERYKPLANGDSKKSAIKQVASGRFGVTSEYLMSAVELQIKMAQGAKPGEGGQLPGHKVWPWIAKVRYSTPGVGLISPPPHHDIYSIEDLAQLIYDLKNSNPQARISVKLVAEMGVGTVAAGVAKAHADVVLISGHDGGTGASPLTSLKHAGVPWELGLAETQQTLVLNKLRDRIIVQTDGQLKTGRDVVIAALLGAEEYGFATAPLVVMGCVMMRVCHLDTCPVGIATQNPRLREKFQGKAEHVINFFMYIAEEVRELMAKLGFRTVEEMIGRGDLLEKRRAIEHYKAQGLDFSKIFYRPEVGPDVAGPQGSRPAARARGVVGFDGRSSRRASRPSSAARKSCSSCRSATSTARSAQSSAAK